MTKTYDAIPAQLEKVQKMHAFIGSPTVTAEVIADLADLTGVPARVVETFVRYGRVF